MKIKRIVLVGIMSAIMLSGYSITGKDSVPDT